MEFSALNALLCPHCGGGFTAPEKWEGALCCERGHSFDIARQGYLNLLTGHGTKFVPDTAAMVAARDAFLDAGHYGPLGDALASTIRRLLPGPGPHMILDAGTGTGWYLQQILAAFHPETENSPAGNQDHHWPKGGCENSGGARSPFAVGMDISKFALRRAARRNPEALNIVWDLWRALPLGANTADVVLVVFAPRNAKEFARVLKPGGTLVVVTPLASHLAEIAQEASLLGIQEDKEAALNHSLEAHFTPAGNCELVVPLQLGPADIANVALMGPAGHHLEAKEASTHLAGLPALSAATAAFRISTFTAKQN
ncbi:MULTISPECIES: putative RNA methyltransferase [Arthrobacter]|uniref:SAM-dependent methyltransferase n=1 Tax=Arthrobacter psychrochitiniphilus TaxID=291045 RepID=A0A2V3DR46_9MICC|nr:MULTISPECIES: methyltransferase domain-containing protein [Arthrobacter]NYG17039.1 23S rRNA (guanine745-N1)-methyltransferase [Arthrobacter psychrochitiniphilus]PXA64746.1 SAM-dependent methyltransferase [Arthrobacter psychrochitiniphilus]